MPQFGKLLRQYPKSFDQGCRSELDDETNQDSKRPVKNQKPGSVRIFWAFLRHVFKNSKIFNFFSDVVGIYWSSLFWKGRATMWVYFQ